MHIQTQQNGLIQQQTGNSYQLMNIQSNVGHSDYPQGYISNHNDDEDDHFQDSDSSDDEDLSYDELNNRKAGRSLGAHEMPLGSRTNYKGHWSKEEVSLSFFLISYQI